LSLERNAIREKRHKGCCPRGGETQREKRRLRRVVMMVMMMVVVMGPGSERGTCKHHQEQRCAVWFVGLVFGLPFG